MLFNLLIKFALGNTLHKSFVVKKQFSFCFETPSVYKKIINRLDYSVIFQLKPHINANRSQNGSTRAFVYNVKKLPEQ